MATTSKAFIADLPDLTAEQLGKLYTWGQSSCEQFDVHTREDSSMMLVAVRKKPGSARDHQRLLRTNLVNWGVNLPAKQSGWLRLAPDNESTLPATSQAASGEREDDNHLSETQTPQADIINECRGAPSRTAIPPNDVPPTLRTGGLLLHLPQNLLSPLCPTA